ncbi:MAG: MarR family transcriptional regulator [Aliarcobacter sp.]|nr:MarR family transcriptional regulator [Aliarcobacter sp.]
MSYELEKSIGFKVNHTANKLNNKYTQLLQSFDIAPEQRATLEIIKYEPDVNQTKIANILGKDKTTISRTLKTLENKNLITKSPIDKRTNLIQLTKKGEEVLNDSFPKVKDFRKKLTSKLSEDELNNLITLLEKVALIAEEEL